MLFSVLATNSPIACFVSLTIANWSIISFQIYDADKMPTKKSGNYSSLDSNPILRTLYDHIDVSV